jgi:ribA/ribD-fused uncharacterized protein
VHAFLSNFYPCRVHYKGIRYPALEYAYQAAKTLDKEERKDILMSASSRIAKRRGQLVTIREDWEEIKIDVMRKLVLEKFSNYPSLRLALLNTGDAELIEGNWWNDTFWGVCEGVGENHLGKILMEVREKLR